MVLTIGNRHTDKQPKGKHPERKFQLYSYMVCANMLLCYDSGCVVLAMGGELYKLSHHAFGKNPRMMCLVCMIRSGIPAL